MKALTVVLFLFFIPMSESFAETLFSCETDKGAFTLERNGNNYVLGTESKTCILTNKRLDVNHNRGLGYDSWEVAVGNDAAICSYAIEYIDQGKGPKYTIVKLDEAVTNRHPCSEGSVVDLLSDI